MFKTHLLAQDFIFFLNLVGPLALGIEVQDHGHWCTELKDKPACETLQSPSELLTQQHHP